MTSGSVLPSLPGPLGATALRKTGKGREKTTALSPTRGGFTSGGRGAASLLPGLLGLLLRLLRHAPGRTAGLPGGAVLLLPLLLPLLLLLLRLLGLLLLLRLLGVLGGDVLLQDRGQRGDARAALEDPVVQLVDELVAGEVAQPDRAAAGGPPLGGGLHHHDVGLEADAQALADPHRDAAPLVVLQPAQPRQLGLVVHPGHLLLRSAAAAAAHHQPARLVRRVSDHLSAPSPPFRPIRRALRYTCRSAGAQRSPTGETRRRCKVARSARSP